MKTQYAIIARFEAKPGCENELRSVLLEAAAVALAEEPGCRRFEILQAVTETGEPLPRTFMSNELFDDYEAVEAHRNSWRTPIRRHRIRSLTAAPTRIETALVLGTEA